MNGTKVLALAAAGVFLVVAAPIGSAQAVSLINPGAAAAVQRDAKEGMTTEVRWHWRHHHHHWRRWHHRRWWHRHHWRRHRW
jgi:hypothetical protein